MNIFAMKHGQGETKLFELYSIGGGGPIIEEVQELPSQKDSFFPKYKKWERRKDLRGALFHSMTLDWPWYSMAEKVAPDGREVLKAQGLQPEIVDHLRSHLNFTLKVVIPDHSSWGLLGQNGQWNGLVGDLINKKCHFCKWKLFHTII